MIRFTVNGNRFEHTGDAEMPLLRVLRDLLGLSGTKFGCGADLCGAGLCGAGLCGACTVHIDSVAQRSCVTPVKAASDRVVTTIEGLSDDGRHPVQLAWQEFDVPQCGYCQAGQIMSVVDLLSRIPKPTDEDIDSQHTKFVDVVVTHVSARLFTGQQKSL